MLGRIYEGVNDAACLSHGPTFRPIGSEKIRDRGAALPSRLNWFETQVLTQAANLSGLAASKLRAGDAEQNSNEGRREEGQVSEK